MLNLSLMSTFVKLNYKTNLKYIGYEKVLELRTLLSGSKKI